MSEILVSISILCYNKAEISKQCFYHLEKTLPDKNVEVLITNNGSTDFTDSVVYNANLNNKVYIPYGTNIGFIKGHNEALKLARGKYFIVMNNDLLIHEDNWLYKLLKPLETDPKIGLVGVANAPKSLKPDGCGYWGRDLEYIDGACIAGRTEDFKNFGLFSESYEMFYCEDSDLSLKFRQMGYRIIEVPIKFTHISSVTANTIDPNFRNATLERNKKIFNLKWGVYLRNRMFTNHILVKANSHGIGDVICMTPIIRELRNEHPKAIINLETPYPEVFFNNPYVDKVHSKPQDYIYAFDRKIDLVPNYASKELIVDECAKVAGVRIENKNPELFMSVDELNEGHGIIKEAKEKTELVVGVCTQMARAAWAGRNWDFAHTQKLIEDLEGNGISVVEIGKDVKSSGLATVDLVNKTNLRQLFSVVANLDYFIGIDSACFHVASAFKILSFILFGATEPCARIVDFNNVVAIRQEGLKCLGCYMKKGVSNWNRCNLGTEECLQGLTPKMVLDFVYGEIDGKKENIKYLENVIRGN